MKINEGIISDIIKIEKEKGYENSAFLIFSLSLTTEIGSVISRVIEELNLSKEIIEEFVVELNKLKVITEKDLKKLKTKKTIKKEVNGIEDVEEQFSRLLNKKIKITATNEKRLSLLLKEYSVDEINMVIEHFYNKWINDPTFAQYIRPQTLFNNKFEERLEEAKEVFSKINKYQKDIYIIYNKFNDLKGITLLGNEKEFISEDIKKLITFWLEKGYTVEDLIITIEESINYYNEKNITGDTGFSRILDEKFPDRVRTAKLRAQKRKDPKLKDGQSAVLNWMKEEKQ